MSAISWRRCFVRKLGAERSRTVILRIPGEWWREFETMAEGSTIGSVIRDVLHGYLKKAGKL